MSKKFITFGILLVVVGSIFIYPLNVYSQEQPVECTKDGIKGVEVNGNCITGTPPKNDSGSAAAAAVDFFVSPLFKLTGQALMTITSLILVISGKIFDTIVSFSIVNMAKNIGDPNGVGGSISSAWATIRDIANMGFIFVLLYAAFNSMFRLDFGKLNETIKNIIIIALLINFSLFFSKVIIDASNIVSVGFYKSIADSNKGEMLKDNKSGILEVSKYDGISGGYMRMLGIQTFFSSDILNPTTPAGKPIKLDPVQILVIGIMTSIFMLITAVVLLIASIMFLARFILLIFLMILSPLALIAYAIPGQRKHFDDWLENLKNQSFFAPLFFALTWIVFKIGNSLIKVLNEQQGQSTSFTSIITEPSSAMGLLLNYLLIIGFTVASLILSKKMASSTFGFKQISGGIGAVGLGGAALLGRQTFGRIANNMANNPDLQKRAAEGDVRARMQLAAAQKLAGSSFDVRGVADTTFGKAVGASKVLDPDITGKASGAGGQKAATDASTDKRRRPIDATMRQFRDQPDVLAKYLLQQKEIDQQYMYDKLSARDRAAINDELDIIGATSTKERLMKNMSIDEREKTSKAGKEAAKDKQNKDRLDTINKIATDPVYAATFTPTGLDALIKSLPNTQARKLSLDVLSGATPGSREIIMRLSTKHLADIASNHDEFNDTTAQAIWNIVDGPPYPPALSAHQTRQWDYLTSPGVKANWGIP